MSIDRSSLRPGQVIEIRQRYVVATRRYGIAAHKHPGTHKLDPIGDAETVVITERWRVWRTRHGRAPGWLASNGAYGGWGTFATHAEAIAYADRRAREDRQP